MKTAFDLKTVLYNKNETGNDIVSRFLKIKNAEFISYSDDKELAIHIDKLKNVYSPKEVVILKPFKGRFFQLCPGSTNVTCCNYRVINTCFNCFFDCTYCFLNSYLNSFGIVQFTNIKDMLNEVDLFLSKTENGRVYRIGSGEFTDSLMMDEITGIGESLIRKCSSNKNIMIELKTKSKNIDHLLAVENKGSAVASWSLNTPRNIAKYEKDSALLDERIDSAKKAGKADFFLAFHFDPIIIYEGWEEDYKNLVHQLFSNVNAEKIVWISMGCFRYSPAFKDVMRNNFPDEELTTEEMFPGVDGKYRYLKNKRIYIYKTIKDNIIKYTDKPFIYLCMETEDVWNSVFNKYYETSTMLEKDLSGYIKKKFL